MLVLPKKPFERLEEREPPPRRGDRDCISCLATRTLGHTLRTRVADSDWALAVRLTTPSLLHDKATQQQIATNL